MLDDMRYRYSLLAVILALAATSALAQEATREYIVLSGGPSLVEWERFKAEPHDKWWGNFIRSARVRIEQLRQQHGPTARITWLVYKPGYPRAAGRQDQEHLIANNATLRHK